MSYSSKISMSDLLHSIIQNDMPSADLNIIPNFCPVIVSPIARPIQLNLPLNIKNVETDKNEDNEDDSEDDQNDIQQNYLNHDYDNKKNCTRLILKKSDKISQIIRTPSISKHLSSHVSQQTKRAECRGIKKERTRNIIVKLKITNSMGNIKKMRSKKETFIRKNEKEKQRNAQNIRLKDEDLWKKIKKQRKEKKKIEKKNTKDKKNVHLKEIELPDCEEIDSEKKSFEENYFDPRPDEEIQVSKENNTKAKNVLFQKAVESIDSAQNDFDTSQNQENTTTTHKLAPLEYEMSKKGFTWTYLSCPEQNLLVWQDIQSKKILKHGEDPDDFRMQNPID